MAYQHAIHFLSGYPARLFSFIVDEAITTRFTEFIGGNFARENVSEQGESVVERLVVDGFVKVLDKNIASSRFPQ